MYAASGRRLPWGTKRSLHQAHPPDPKPWALNMTKIRAPTTVQLLSLFRWWGHFWNLFWSWNCSPFLVVEMRRKWDHRCYALQAVTFVWALLCLLRNQCVTSHGGQRCCTVQDCSLCLLVNSVVMLAGRNLQAWCPTCFNHSILKVFADVCRSFNRFENDLVHWFFSFLMVSLWYGKSNAACTRFLVFRRCFF